MSLSLSFLCSLFLATEMPSTQVKEEEEEEEPVYEPQMTRVKQTVVVSIPPTIKILYKIMMIDNNNE